MVLKNIVSTVKLAKTFGLPIVHSTVNVSSGRSKPTTLGALTLLGRAGAAISSPPAGFGDLAREGSREAPAPSQGAIGGAGKGAPRTR